LLKLFLMAVIFVIIKPDYSMIPPHEDPVYSLLQASEGSDVKAVADRLKAAGANVNAIAFGYTPLMVAAERGSAEVVTYLIEEGAQIDVQNPKGMTPLMLAAKSGRNEIVKILLNAHANIHIATKRGQTALHVAAMYGEGDIVQMLIEHNADVNAQDNAGNTPLILAVRSIENQEADIAKYIRVVQLLLTNGARVTQTNAKGENALDIAYALPSSDLNEELIRLLLQGLKRELGEITLKRTMNILSRGQPPTIASLLSWARH
jgi:ankyrin repeat protein